MRGELLVEPSRLGGASIEAVDAAVGSARQLKSRATGLFTLLATLALIYAAALLPLAADAQQTFPATAVIRGENVWLRAAPANQTTVFALLQRGDTVTLTGPLTAADGDAFYPVSVSSINQSGWVR